MSNNMEFEIEGMEELLREFAKLGEDHYEKLRPSAIIAGELVLRKARLKINDKTGELSSALKVRKPTKPRVGEGQVVAKVTFTKKGAHGVPLELGHRLFYFGHKTNRDVEAKPFMRPAADESKDEVRDIIAGAMNKILKEWGE